MLINNQNPPDFVKTWFLSVKFYYTAYCLYRVYIVIAAMHCANFVAFVDDLIDLTLLYYFLLYNYLSKFSRISFGDILRDGEG